MTHGRGQSKEQECAKVLRCQWGSGALDVHQCSWCPDTWESWVNSLAPGRSGFDFINAIINLVLLISIFRLCLTIIRWMPQDLSVDMPTLVLVMAWCRHAMSSYLSLYWSRYMSPYGINSLGHKELITVNGTSSQFAILYIFMYL